MRHKIIEASRNGATPQNGTENQDNIGVYCPNCGSYQGDRGGLKVDSEWRKCAPSCPSLMRDGAKLIKSDGGKNFPIYYSSAHLRDQSDVIMGLEKRGYTKVSEDIVPGVGANQDYMLGDMVTPRILPENPRKNDIMRQFSAHAVFGPVKDFLAFVKQNHPAYLEVEQMEDGVEEKKVKKTYFLHYEGVKNVTATTKKKTLFALATRLFK